MSKRPAQDVRREREQVLAPLFAYMVGRGIRRSWLAQELGISTALLWNYEHGVTRLPPDFVRRACKSVGFSSRKITIPEPRDLYIQQSRTSSRSASVKSAKTTKRTATR